MSDPTPSLSSPSNPRGVRIETPSEMDSPPPPTMWSGPSRASSSLSGRISQGSFTEESKKVDQLASPPLVVEKSTKPNSMKGRQKPPPLLLLSAGGASAPAPPLRPERVSQVMPGKEPSSVEPLVGAEEWSEETKYLLDLCRENQEFGAEEVTPFLPEGETWNEAVQYIFEKREGGLALVGKIAPTDLNDTWKRLIGIVLFIKARAR